MHIHTVGIVFATAFICGLHAFAATHNIAFRRAVYQSSAADFTHVGHLATDGKVTVVQGLSPKCNTTADIRS